MTTDYPSSAAALFAVAARERPKARDVIWAYCPTCWDRTEQEYERDHGIYEEYRCRGCGQVHQVAVR